MIKNYTISRKVLSKVTAANPSRVISSEPKVITKSAPDVESVKLVAVKIFPPESLILSLSVPTTKSVMVSEPKPAVNSNISAPVPPVRTLSSVFPYR